MKLKVQHRNGATETITLVPPVALHLGSHLNSLSDGSGMDHYFDLDGYYDGWGTATSDATMIQIWTVEEGREF